MIILNILLVAHFTKTPNEKGNNRFNYIADRLSEENTVELITSSFCHESKKQRKLEKEGLEKLKYKFTAIYEPGYTKNVSLRRFYSHYIMAKNLRKYLNKIEIKPDVIYCAVP